MLLPLALIAITMIAVTCIYPLNLKLANLTLFAYKTLSEIKPFRHAILSVITAQS